LAPENDEAGNDTSGGAESIAFYKFMVEYRYKDGKLISATVYCQPYTDEAITQDTAPIKVSYKVGGSENSPTWEIDAENTTKDLQGLSYFETDTIIATALVDTPEVREKVRQQGESALVQAQGTIKQVEKAKQDEQAKWKITTTEAESMTTYSLAEQTEPHRYLSKTVFSDVNVTYMKSVSTTNADETLTTQIYRGEWGKNLDCDPGQLYYESATYTRWKYDETVQRFAISTTEAMNDGSTGEIKPMEVQILIGSKQEIQDAYDQYKAVYDKYPNPDYDSYEHYAQFKAACEEVEQKRNEEYKKIPHIVTCIFNNGVYDETIGALGTPETIEAVRKKMIEQYSGDEELSDDASIAELLEAWEKSVASVIWETRDQVENLLS
jgi:hypothetical protein